MINVCALQIELIFVPLVLLDASILQSYYKTIWVLNIIWILIIVDKFQTINPEKPYDYPIHIAGIYLVNEFIFDIAATLPSFLAPYNNKAFISRVIHIIELRKVRYPLHTFVDLVMPNSRTGRLNLSLVIKFLYFILIGAHYMICLWLWIGT